MLSAKHLTLYLIAQLVILLGLSYWIYEQNQPVDLAKPAHTKFQCVSYAPYYQIGQTPLNPDTMVARQQIQSDLQQLAKITDCVRTYSVNQGLAHVPAVAKEVGLSVYLGAWIGWTDEDNLKEIDLATKVANAYPNTVKGIIIGNEVLLRQEQNEATLKRYLKHARAKTALPLTYADVWEFWLRHPTLEQDVDFVTVHILPYWEDDPVNVANGTAHAKGVMQRLKKHFSKPLLIGETGWPSAGRQRNTSAPGNVNQARYIREFMTVAETEGWQYNIIEAVDQPWKRSLEGTVGAFWGLYDSSLAPKFDLQAPVAERHDGGLPIIAAMLGAILFFTLSGNARPSGHSSHSTLGLRIGNTLLGASAAMMSLLQLHYLSAAGTSWLANLPLITVILTGWFSLIAIVKHLAHSSNSATQWLNWTTLLLLAFSLITSYLLFHDGRYRNFPNSLFILPALLLCLHTWLIRPPLQFGKWRFIPIAISVIYAILVISMEPDNVSALLWAGIVGLLVLANWPRTHYQYLDTDNN